MTFEKLTQRYECEAAERSERQEKPMKKTVSVREIAPAIHIKTLANKSTFVRFPSRCPMVSDEKVAKLEPGWFAKINIDHHLPKAVRHLVPGGENFTLEIVERKGRNFLGRVDTKGLLCSGVHGLDTGDYVRFSACNIFAVYPPRENGAAN